METAPVEVDAILQDVARLRARGASRRGFSQTVDRSLAHVRYSVVDFIAVEKVRVADPQVRYILEEVARRVHAGVGAARGQIQTAFAEHVAGEAARE